MFEAYVPWGSYRISVPEVIPKGEGSKEEREEMDDSEDEEQTG